MKTRRRGKIEKLTRMGFHYGGNLFSRVDVEDFLIRYVAKVDVLSKDYACTRPNV